MTEPDTLIGGRFRILEALGTGGQGTVYRAEMVGPRGFSRVVALKRLHSNDLGPVARFVDEARLAAFVRHPNVVQTLEIVEDEVEGELVIVMEHVEGASLSQVVSVVREAGTRVPVPIALAVLSGALRGLHAAHEAQGPDGTPLGIVHRDFSPANIMIDKFGVAKVLDFGVAKAHKRIQEQTRAGQLKGKLGYMAPEQIHGAGDRSIDLWAAGVVLWELLTGRRLFVGESPPRLLSRVLAEPIEPPSTYNPDLSKELQRVAKKSVERDPAQRFARADLMAEALEACGPASAQEVAQFITHGSKDTATFTATELSEGKSDSDAHFFESVSLNSLDSLDSVNSLDSADSAATQTIGVSEGIQLNPRRGVVAVVALLLISVFALAVWRGVRGDPDVVAAKPRAHTAAPPATPPAVEMARSPATDPAVSVALSQSQTASVTAPTAPAAEPEPVTSKPPAKRRARRRRSKKTKPSKKTTKTVAPVTKPATDCEVPWAYVDGVKKWKRECF